MWPFILAQKARNMADHLEKPAPPGGPPGDGETGAVSTGAISQARRRLLRGGISAAPVVMTLASRPVLGGTCLTPSAFVSGNVSIPAGDLPICTGHLPAWWIANTGSWPAGYYPVRITGANGVAATTFASVFGSNYLVGSQYNTTTLLEVLGAPTLSPPVPASPSGLANHIVAALLNSAAALTPVLSVTDVKGIWTEYVTTGRGTFSPTSGVNWTAADIVAYLQTTMS